MPGPPLRSGPSGAARLDAEMASAFVCATLSIEPTVRHADYIGSWLQVLREDNRAIFRAAGQASKAANLLLGLRSNGDDVKWIEPKGPSSSV